MTVRPAIQWNQLQQSANFCPLPSGAAVGAEAVAGAVAAAAKAAPSWDAAWQRKDAARRRLADSSTKVTPERLQRAVGSA